MINWLKKKHGGLSYTFEKAGVLFIGLWSKFDPKGKPAQPLTNEALTYLKEQLAKMPKGKPAVVTQEKKAKVTTKTNDTVKGQTKGKQQGTGRRDVSYM